MKKIWSEYEQKKFVEIYHLYTKAELAEIFNTTLSSIEYMGIKTGLIKPKEKNEVPEGMKYCEKCKEILPLDHFNNRTNSKDGKQSYGRACSRLIKVLEYHRNKDKEKEQKIQEYINANKGKVFYCKSCGCTHTIDDYIIVIDPRRKNPGKLCRKTRMENQRRNNQKRRLNNI